MDLNLASIMLFFYGMIGLLLVAILAQQWQLRSVRRRILKIERAFDSVLDDSRYPPDVPKNALLELEAVLRGRTRQEA